MTKQDENNRSLSETESSTVIGGKATLVEREPERELAPSHPRLVQAAYEQRLAQAALQKALGAANKSGK